MRTFTPGAIPIFLHQRPAGGPGRYYPFESFQVYYDFPPVPGFHIMGAEVSKVFSHFEVEQQPVIAAFSVSGNAELSRQILYFDVQLEDRKVFRYLNIQEQKAFLGFDVFQ